MATKTCKNVTRQRRKHYNYALRHTSLRRAQSAHGAKLARLIKYTWCRRKVACLSEKQKQKHTSYAVITTIFQEVRKRCSQENCRTFRKFFHQSILSEGGAWGVGWRGWFCRTIKPMYTKLARYSPPAVHHISCSCDQSSGSRSGSGQTQCSSGGWWEAGQIEQNHKQINQSHCFSLVDYASP